MIRGKEKGDQYARPRESLVGREKKRMRGPREGLERFPYRNLIFLLAKRGVEGDSHHFYHHKKQVPKAPKEARKSPRFS